MIRDSKFPRGNLGQAVEPTITVDRQAWLRFVDEVAQGDGNYRVGTLALVLREDAMVELHSVVDGTTLTFTMPEWEAFRAGVRLGELR